MAGIKIPDDKVSIYSDLKAYTDPTFYLSAGKYKPTGGGNVMNIGYNGPGNSYSVPTSSRGVSGSFGGTGVVYVYYMY